MQNKSSQRLSRLLEYICDVLLLCAAVATATLYWTIPAVTHHYPATDGRFEKYMIVMTVSGLAALYLLWQTRGVMRHVKCGAPFVLDTVRRLRAGGVACLLLSAFYLTTIFWVTKLYMLIVMVVFLVIGLLLLVLAQMIQQAITFKEENDMTI